MVEGITEDQYRQLNEFPLSEQTRSLPAKHAGCAVQYLKTL